MQAQLTQLLDSTVFWSTCLIIGYPIVMVVLSEAILQFRQRRRLLSQGLAALRNLVLPVAAVWILFHFILDLDPQKAPVRVVQTLLLISLVHVALMFANALLFTGQTARKNRVHVPRLLRDLVRFFLVLVGAAIILSVVWGADLGGLVAALGVGSLVIGLALQDPMGNLFSGLTLLFEQPFAVGDWITTGDTTGKIIEINWRAVHLVTREQEMIIVPNAVLAKEIVRNYRRPQRLHIEPVDIGFSYDNPPNFVKQVLRETALATPGVLSEPEPVIQTLSYDDSSILYRVRLFLVDYEQVPQIRDEFNSRVWYASKRNGLNIPFPIRTLMHQPMRSPNATDLLAERVRKLRAFPLFHHLPTEALEDLGHSAELHNFGRGEPILKAGTEQVRMHLLVQGTVEVLVPQGHGEWIQVAKIAQGNFFGESALMPRQSSIATIAALDDVEVMVLDTAQLQQVVDHHPKVLLEIDQIMEVRRRETRSLKQKKTNTSLPLTAKRS